MKHINVTSLKDIISAEKSNSSIDFINVCTTAEYKEKHISGVRSVPLDTLATRLSEFKGKKTIYVHCRSGNRSSKAIETLHKLGVKADLVNVEGGLMAWEEAKYPTNSLTNRLPLMRQVFLAAGSLVLVGTVLGIFLGPLFLVIPLFVGGGLVVSGSTGWCGMAMLLSRMPWNK
jgi:rhodanese-related sulfurtransferase